MNHVSQYTLSVIIFKFPDIFYFLTCDLINLF